MLETESPAMERNGVGLPSVPVQNADWSMDQTAAESITSVLPEGSVTSLTPSVEQHLLDHHVNSTGLGSVEKAVEEIQNASAQLFHGEQPPLPPEPAEEGKQSSDHKAESVPMTAEAGVPVPDGTQGT